MQATAREKRRGFVKETAVSMTDKIYRILQQDIISGKYKIGEKLPSENSLCKKYNVSRPTVRGALKNLQALGMIKTNTGQGSFVLNPSIGGFINQILPVEEDISSQDFLSFIEFRRIIEGSTAYQACIKATDKQTENLEYVFAEMVRSKENMDDFLKFNFAFHLAIAGMTENPLVIGLYECIYDMFEKNKAKFVKIVMVDKILIVCSMILGDFKKRQPDQAKKHMDALLDSFLLHTE